MRKRLFVLIAIICLIVFIPYLVFLLINAIYPDFIFIPHKDDYGIVILRWLLGILAIGLVSGVTLIIGMTYNYVRYGIEDNSNEENEHKNVELYSKERIRQTGIDCELNSLDIDYLIENL